MKQKTKMKNLALILARKNSKRLKKKNLLKIGGFTLVERAIRSAINSKKFHKILVSSDDEKILALKQKYKNVTFEKRKRNLAGDKIKVIKVVIDIISRNRNYHSVALLQTTCPFRTGKDINNAFHIFKRNYLNTIAICEYDFPPEFAIFTKGDYFTPGSKSPLLRNQTRSQDFKKLFRPNGAIYLALTKNLFKKKNFYSKKMNAYIMTRENSIDIDTKLDYEVAKRVYEQNKKYR